MLLRLEGVVLFKGGDDTHSEVSPTERRDRAHKAYLRGLAGSLGLSAIIRSSSSFLFISTSARAETCGFETFL